MDNMYNKDERQESIDKRWESIKSTIINATKIKLNKKIIKPTQKWITQNIIELNEKRRKHKHWTDVKGQLKY